VVSGFNDTALTKKTKNVVCEFCINNAVQIALKKCDFFVNIRFKGQCSHVNTKVISSENGVGVGEIFSLVWFPLHSRLLREAQPKSPRSCRLCSCSSMRIIYCC
jgi:hypothetical protein